MPQLDHWTGALYKAIHAARLGREVLLGYFGKLEHIEHKHMAGLVSEADKASEKAIFSYLRTHFPNDEMLGEESTPDPDQISATSSKPGRWIVDPLDGTTNYVHRFPMYCVSIGYEWRGQIMVGVVDIPALGEVYTAIRGRGAFVNGRRLAVSQAKSLSDSLLATGFFPEIEENLQEQLQVFAKIVRKCQGVRRAGAAAIDLCLVASGVFDGYWEKNLRPWDSAAGLLLVQEAGGLVTTYRGAPYTPFKNSIIAGNAQIVEQIKHAAASEILPSSH